MSRFVLLGLIALGLVMAACWRHTAAATAPTVERPLILEQNQGEVRVWRPLKSSPGWEKVSFIIKVDRQNGGSPDFWFLSESPPPEPK